MFDKITNILSDKDTWTPIFTAMATAITGLFTWDNLQRIIFGTATPMADAKNTLIDKKDKAIETVSNVTAPIKNVIKNAVDFFRPEKDQATINDATSDQFRRINKPNKNSNDYNTVVPGMAEQIM